MTFALVSQLCRLCLRQMRCLSYRSLVRSFSRDIHVRVHGTSREGGRNVTSRTSSYAISWPQDKQPSSSFRKHTSTVTHFQTYYLLAAWATEPLLRHSLPYCEE
jgi:hypothetical protein